MAQENSLIVPSSLPKTNVHKGMEYGILLPPSYEGSIRSFPVIYYLHGLGGHYSDGNSENVAHFFTGLFSSGILPECILVFPDGKGGFWLNHYDGDPLLEKEIVDYLIPFIDTEYSVDTMHRVIMGWSAGGAGAVTIFSKNPRLFKTSISLDGPIISWEEFLYIQGNKPEVVNNSDYYYENASPFEWVKTNREIIAKKQDTTIFLSASMFAPSHQPFVSRLKEENIPFIFKELDCQHAFHCIFSETKVDLIAFLSRIPD